jgi:carbon storage regulator CsrA
MLVLSRRCDAEIRIGSDITIKVLAIHKRQVELGIEAPRGISVWRGELLPLTDHIYRLGVLAWNQRANCLFGDQGRPGWRHCHTDERSDLLWGTLRRDPPRVNRHADGPCARRRVHRAEDPAADAVEASRSAGRDCHRHLFYDFRLGNERRSLGRCRMASAGLTVRSAVGYVGRSGANEGPKGPRHGRPRLEVRA